LHAGEHALGVGRVDAAGLRLEAALLAGLGVAEEGVEAGAPPQVAAGEVPAPQRVGRRARHELEALLAAALRALGQPPLAGADRELLVCVARLALAQARGRGPMDREGGEQ